MVGNTVRPYTQSNSKAGVDYYFVMGSANTAILFLQHKHFNAQSLTYKFVLIHKYIPDSRLEAEAEQ